jgi:hypothetical protein
MCKRLQVLSRRRIHDGIGFVEAPKHHQACLAHLHGKVPNCLRCRTVVRGSRYVGEEGKDATRVGELRDQIKSAATHPNVLLMVEDTHKGFERPRIGDRRPKPALREPLRSLRQDPRVGRREQRRTRGKGGAALVPRIAAAV